MKKILTASLIWSFALCGLTSCIEEAEPQGGYASDDQVANAPGVFDSFVKGLTGNMVGSFKFGTSYPWDYGYPTFYLTRDVMGQDIAIEGADFYTGWYTCSVGLGPHYLICQVPMTYFYKWINDCNTVIRQYKLAPAEEKESGVGIAYCMRALYYMDVAQMYGTLPYAADKDALTAPIRTDENAAEKHVARATNKEMFEDFILGDLDHAENYIKNYVREDVYTPDLSVVYGLKARAYLLMENWEKAEEYAKKAQEGYTMMSEAEYLDRNNGFNTPTSSWMFGLTFKNTDDNITANDGDCSWGSQMIMEVKPSEMGYAANYGAIKRMDAHLYSTIPATDFRRKMFVDFALDELNSDNPAEYSQIINALSQMSDVPEDIYESVQLTESQKLGGVQLKFRPKNGEHNNQYNAWTVAVPIMRVEEMKLIEIEAAGMQDEARGKQLLENFAKTRDPQYVYGKHTRDAYYNQSTGGFRNEVWWQRRVELWGEGFSMYDIKRLQKGIIRSYAGTNHVENYRWNVETTPQWMVHCFVQTESNYNNKLVNNPTPVYSEGDSPEFVFPTE